MLSAPRILNSWTTPSSCLWHSKSQFGYLAAEVSIYVANRPVGITNLPVHPGTTGKPVVNLSMKFHWPIWPLVLALGVRCCTRDLGTARSTGHWWSLHEIAAGPPWNVQSTSGALWWIFDGYLMDIHSLLLFYRGISEARECFRNLQDSTGAWVNPKSLQSLKMWYFEATIAEMTCVDPCPRWWKEQRCLGVFERSYIYTLFIYYIVFSCLNCQTRPAVGRRSRRIPARGRWPGEKRWGSIAAYNFGGWCDQKPHGMVLTFHGTQLAVVKSRKWTKVVVRPKGPRQLSRKRIKEVVPHCTACRSLQKLKDHRSHDRTRNVDCLPTKKYLT